MPKEKTESKVYQIADLVLERDKARATEELKNYFVDKNRQEQSWQITNTLIGRLRQKAFSNAEAGEITSFLVREFDIRYAAIQYSQDGYLGPKSPNTISDKIRMFPKRGRENTEAFYDIYLRLRLAVEDNLLDYRGAQSLVKEIIHAYPASRSYVAR